MTSNPPTSLDKTGPMAVEYASKEDLHDAQPEELTKVAVADNPAVQWVMSLSPEEYAQAEKKLLRKVDSRLLPCLFSLLILNYLDRNALAAARVQGLEKDLKLEGNQFNVAISILFVGYILGGIPANLILSRTRPSLFISGFCALWGVVSSTTAVADSFQHLVVIRFFLGLVEAPFFPGAVFILSSWYTKKQLAFRTSFFFLGSLLSSAFSGFITAGIQYGMDGAKGLPAWKWTFIIEGAVTVFAAFLTAVILPDYPGNTKWLNDREKALAVHRLQRDAGVNDEEDMPLMQALKSAATDYKLYIIAVIMMCKGTAAGVTQFIPTVVATFGRDKIHTLLLTAPPYLLATILAFMMSYSSDRKPERCFHLMGPLAIGSIGFIIAATTKTTAPRYFALFLAVGGMYASYNVALAWVSSTFPRPRARRAAAYAIINSLNNIAQIWAPYLYLKKYSPRYTVAFIVNCIMAALACSCCLLLRYCLKRENRKRDERVARNEEGAEEGLEAIRFVL